MYSKAVISIYKRQKKIKKANLLSFFLKIAKESPWLILTINSL